MTATVNDYSLAKNAEPALVSGLGQHHSDRNKAKPQAYLTISLSEIEVMLSIPQQVEKHEAQWFIPSTLKDRNHSNQRNEGQYWALWAETDEPTATLNDMVTVISAKLPDVQILAYTTKSATKIKQKARFVLPLDEAIDGKTFIIMQRIFNSILAEANIVPDRANERAGQLCYLPNRGDFYITEHVIGDKLSPSMWRDRVTQAVEEQKLEQKAQTERMAAAKVRQHQRQQTDQLSPIGAFNETYELPLLFAQYGYLKRGLKWLSPNSSSKSPGVTIKDNRWISNHESDRDDGLGKANDSGASGDAFDLFMFYEHGNDRTDALKALGSAFTTADGITLTKSNQRNYMQQAAADEPLMANSSGTNWPSPADSFSDDFESDGVFEETPAGIDLNNPPGLAGVICNLISETAKRKRPELYPLAALHLMALIGNKKSSIYTPKLNLVTLGIGLTATGKEKAQDAVKRLARSVNRSKLIHGNAGSFKDMIYNLLEGDGASLYIIDEIHSLFGSMKSKNAQTYESKMETEILVMSTTKLYTFRGIEKREIFANVGKCLGQLKKRLEAAVDIKEQENLQRAIESEQQRYEWLEHGLPDPFFSLMGHSTPTNLDGFIKPENIDSGFLGRTLVVRCPETREQLNRSPINNDKISALEHEIYEGLCRIKDNVSPISPTEEARLYLDQCVDWYDEDERRNHGLLGGIYARGPEQLFKVASILGLAQGLITLEMAQYAHALVKASTEDIKHILLQAYANSDGASEQTIILNAKEVIYRNCKGQGQTLSRLKQLISKPKPWLNLAAKDLKRDRFQELLDTMVGNGDIRLVKQGKKERYVSQS